MHQPFTRYGIASIAWILVLMTSACVQRSSYPYNGSNSNSPYGNSGSNGSNGSNGSTGTAQPTGAVPTGSGNVAGADYAGNGTGTASPSTVSGANAIAPTIDAQAPDAYSYLPPSAIQAANNLASDPTNAAYRIALANEIVMACSKDAAALAPQAGEPLLGDWTATCTDTGELTYVNVFGKYPSNSAGHPTGMATFWSVALNDSDAGAGQLSINSQGDAAAYYATTYGTYLAYFTDKPTSGTATATNVSGAPECVTVTAALTVSRNPIPAKHVEAVQRLGACYRQAITLYSPIIYNYLYYMNPASAQQIMSALNLY